MKASKVIIYCLLPVLAFGVVLFYSVGSSPRRAYGARDRAFSINRLSQLLKSYREINNRDPKKMYELMETEFEQWRDLEKSVAVWPNWAAEYCGERPSSLQSMEDKIWDEGPYELYENDVSEYIVMERHVIPSIQQRRFAIKRVNLEPALVQHP